MVGAKEKHCLPHDANPWSAVEKHLPAPGIRWEETGSSWYLQAVSLAPEREKHPQDTDESPGTNPLLGQFCFHDYALARTLGLPRSSKRCFSHVRWILCFFATWQAKMFPLQDYFSKVKWGELFCYGRLCSSSSLAEKEIFITWVLTDHIFLVSWPEPNCGIAVQTMLWQFQSFQVIFLVIFKV